MQPCIRRYLRGGYLKLIACGCLWVSSGIGEQTAHPAPQAAHPAAARPAAPAARPATPAARTPASAGRQGSAAPGRQGTTAAGRQGTTTPGRQGTAASSRGRQGATQAHTPTPTNFSHVTRPQGTPAVSRLANGGSRQTYANRTAVEKDASGRTTHYSDPNHGVEARFDPRSGRATQISTGGIGNRTNIQRGAFNERRIETVRTVPGGVERVVHYGNYSSVQRPILGRPGYVQRTVFVGGVSYAGVYHSYAYHGVILFSPVPAVVFAPAYYGWLISPWPQPVIYPPAYWGWAGQPWYGAYGPAFVPYPAYATPDQWLTDYIIAANLRQAYENQQQAANAGPPPGMPQITDEEKAIIAQDVRDELARQRQMAANPPPDNVPLNNAPVGDNLPPPPPVVNANATPVEIPEALKDHLFMVYTAPLEVKKLSGESCSLTEGDMLFRTGAAPNPDNSVDVLVKSSHATPAHQELCPAQERARVQLADLQEMYNHKKELLAQGEQKQTELMGKARGLPKGPDPKPTPLNRGKIDPDTAAAVAELKQMIKDADDTEKEVSAVATTGS